MSETTPYSWSKPSNPFLHIFQELSDNGVSIHLVECSQQMRKIQESTLCGYFHGHAHTYQDERQENTSKKNIDMYEHRAVTKFGLHVYWYPRFEDVPEAFSFYLAHEFFDALPIHKFVKTKEGQWREILIDIDEQNGNLFRFVQSKFATPALQFIDLKCEHEKTAIEISPKTGVIVQNLSNRIDQFGGGALIADYGQNEVAEDSFRAFKNHQIHDVLKDPGSADLTADVDFSYIRKHCNEHTVAYGPVSQREFLLSLGIDIRYKRLSEACSEKDKRDLYSAYQTLIDPDKMGTRFQFFSIFPKTMLPIHHQYPPAGFKNLNT